MGNAFQEQSLEFCHLNRIEYLFQCFILFSTIDHILALHNNNFLFENKEYNEKETLDNGSPYPFSDSEQINCHLKSDDNRVGNAPCDTFLPPNCPSNYLTKIYGAMECRVNVTGICHVQTYYCCRICLIDDLCCPQMAWSISINSL